MTVGAPTTAERIRSACARAGSATLALDGLEPVSTAVHHLLDDGSFALTAPVAGALHTRVVAAGAGGAQAMLELTDYAPLPLREPVRSLVWIRGRLHATPAAETAALLDAVATEDPNPALLRLQIDSVVAADSTGAESIPVSTLLQARPDPFCSMESCWLQHLEAVHREVVDRLAARLPMTLRQGRVRPLSLDRYGLQLRVENEHGDHDVRLSFGQPVDDVTGLSKAIRVLMGCPFLNGLRARQR